MAAARVCSGASMSLRVQQYLYIKGIIQMPNHEMLNRGTPIKRQKSPSSNRFLRCASAVGVEGQASRFAGTPHMLVQQEGETTGEMKRMNKLLQAHDRSDV